MLGLPSHGTISERPRKMTSEHFLRGTLQRRASALALAMTICPATALASNSDGVAELIELAGFVLLSPVYVLIAVALFLGWFVEKRRAAVASLWALGSLGVPALVVSLWVLKATLPYSESTLAALHVGAVSAVMGLVIAGAWSFFLLIRTASSGDSQEKKT